MLMFTTGEIIVEFLEETEKKKRLIWFSKFDKDRNHIEYDYSTNDPNDYEKLQEG